MALAIVCGASVSIAPASAYVEDSVIPVFEAEVRRVPTAENILVRDGAHTQEDRRFCFELLDQIGTDFNLGRDGFGDFHTRTNYLVGWQKILCILSLDRIKGCFVNRQIDRVDESHHGHTNSRGLSLIPVFDLNLKRLPQRQDASIHSFNANVSSQLAFGRVSGDPVGLKGKEQGAKNKQAADTAYPSAPRCPPGRISGCIRRFPLGAQIGISLIIAGLAWASIWGAFRPFGLLVITRRDALQGAGAALLGVGLLGLSGYVWMMGG
jgi:hypothetical protein